MSETFSNPPNAERLIGDAESGSPIIEPERYEFFEEPSYRFSMTRRDLFKALGAGIAILVFFNGSDGLAQESGGGRREGRGADRGSQEIGAWLHIGETGKVTVFTGKVEVGQNSRTALAQAAAEELRVPVSDIEMVMGDTFRVPYDPGTFGSRSTPDMNPKLRKAAAAARELLLDRAAEEWKVDRSGLIAKDGRIVEVKGSRAAGYGSLVKGLSLLQAVRDDAPLTPATEWKTMGHSVKKLEGLAGVTGKKKFASDIARPGMLYGEVLRAPAIGSKLSSVDTKKAEVMEGVVVVKDGDFVGVAAPNSLAAMRAIEAIKAEWTADDSTSSSDTIFADLKRDGAEANVIHEAGSVEVGLASADQKLKRAYTLPYIAHAPLEPRAAVAEWKDGILSVWAGTQRPFGYRDELMHAFNLPEDHVHVMMPDTGSGYGGKHTGESAIEAARLAKAAGKPVKRVWSREEEFTWAYFRPAGVMEASAGVMKDGTIVSWEFHNYNSGTSGIPTSYDIPNQKIVFHPSRSPLRQGSYRGLAATANHFARESFMDELAHEAEMEPLAFRLNNLKDERLIAVFQKAAETFGWGKAKASSDRGFGIAGGFEKGGYVATCVEVSASAKTGKIRVIRGVTAFDCGAVVNPDQLKNQIEGAFMMGIGGALFEGIEFEKGKIGNASFFNYRVPRFSDAPAFEAVLIDRKDIVSAGAGETPIVGVAPAIGNAVFDATGVRLRAMPLKLESA